MSLWKCLLAAVVGFVVMFVLSALWHLVILEDFYFNRYPTPGQRQETLILFVGLGYLVLGLLMAFIYPQGYKGGSPAGEGARFGALIGLLWILPRSLVLYGVMESSGIALVVDAVWHVLEGGVGGVAIAFVYGRSAAAPSA